MCNQEKHHCSKENVKAKIKVIVKRTLRQYGYPQNMQKLLIERVLRQDELIVEKIAHTNLSIPWGINSHR